MTPVSLVDRPVLNRPAPRKMKSDARWLITFADLAAVMVAFFVLIFAMAEVDSSKWDGATAAFDRQFRIAEESVTPRPVETANITQRVAETGLDLRYLERVVRENLNDHEALRDVRMEVSPDQLVLDFPGTLVFATGRVGVTASGREALFALGGMFAGVENQVAVIGQAIPKQTVDGQSDISWEVSLARAARVARALRSAGYDRPIQLQGRSGSRFSGPVPVFPAQSHSTSVSRMEIIVRNETGDGQ